MPDRKLGSFGRSVSIVAGGTAGSQLILLFASPIITRLYSPSDFGALAVFAGILAILVVIGSFRYDMAIPLPGDDTEAANVLGAALIILGLTTMVVALVVAIFHRQIGVSFSSPELSAYLWLVPIGLLAGGIYQCLHRWSIRQKRFGLIAKTKLLQGISVAVTQIAGSGLGPVALFFGHVLSVGAGSLSLAKGTGVRAQFAEIRWSRMRSALARYVRFPVYSMWGALFNTASSQLPALLLAAVHGPLFAGLFALTMRVVASPMSIVSQALGDVYFANAGQALRSGTIGRDVKFLHKKLTALVFPPALLLAICAPPLFAILFGEQWALSGTFAQILLPFISLQVVSAPLSTTLTVMEKQAQATAWHGALLLLRGGALIVGGIFGGATLAVAMFAAVSFAGYLFLISWVFVATGNSLRDVVSTVLSSTAASLVIALPFALAVYLGSGFAPILLGTFASGLMLLVWYATQLRPSGPLEPKPAESIFIGGDLFLSLPAKAHSWTKLFQVPDYYAAKDRILNLEAPITDKAEHAEKSVLWSGSWAFSHLVDAKISAVMLANNHAHDKLQAGLRDTIDGLSVRGIPTFGAGSHIAEAASPVQLADRTYVLGFCEFAKPHLRQIKVATDQEWGVNPLTYEHIVECLEALPSDARAIVLLHWGREHTLFPPSENIRLARRILSHPKVATIVAHHPHVAQGYISAHGKRAYMSIGHALFDEFYFLPPSLVTEDEPATSRVTYDYHKVSSATRKLWRRRSRASLYILFDPSSGAVVHRPIWQERGTPVVRPMIGLRAKMFMAKLEFVSTLYHIPQPLYEFLSRVTWARRQHVNLLLYIVRVIREDGIRVLIQKVMKRVGSSFAK